ncbi:thylakoid membrane photosystem I accumulation factor [Calothrix rhizosoleniae]|uniref:thylakoid membrane photosystem I accumulation factor n=1 Tax=Calothrix rhizosoleniae TaxID=888997 RepID=UPI000B49F3C1|nr:thylakoid membrane photosystem I accumulation factor [Calothrix rhizosoleniae]
MKGIKLYFLHAFVDRCQLILSILIVITCLLITTVQPAIAGINDDRYDGNIFVVYAGNGSLVPPAQTLAQTLAEHKPAILTFYLEDSSDCKQYAIVISQIQAFYGRAAELIPINVDSLPHQKSYKPTEAGYYYSGGIPQVVIFDQAGKVVFNQKGQVPYEDIDDSLRQVFNLLPRTESVRLKRRSYNELNSELTP